MSARILLVVALVGALLAPSLPATAAPGTAAYDQIVDLTFPSRPSVHFTDTYDACRSGCERRHKATDLMGPKMTPLYATVNGVICDLDDGAEDHYGRHITVCGDDGRRYRYLHLNNDTPGTDDGRAPLHQVYAPFVREGLRVVAGQHIAFMGDSGNAEWTASHLHLDVFDDRVTDPYGDNRMNAYPSLQAALASGRVSDGRPYYAKKTWRVAGPDRVGTAVALSQKGHGRAKWVVIAPAEEPGETIVAGPLARTLGGPVLTTYSRGLDDRVAAEIRRLGSSHAVLVGDSLSASVRRGLERAGIPRQNQRVIAGRHRFETAALVAEEVWDLAGGDRTALVALGSHPNPTRSWPDSLMASYYGARTGAPVLLVPHNRMPASTAAALETASSAVIFGGDGAIRPELAKEVTRRVPRVRRLAGTTRISTATAVVEDLVRRGLVDSRLVWAATGHNWPDAVTAGPMVAKRGEVLVLVDGRARGGDVEVEQWLAPLRRHIDAARVIGGPNAIAKAALRLLSRRIT